MSFKILFFLLIFSSCALFRESKEREMPPNLVTGQNLNLTKASEIKKALLMNSSMAGGDFKIAVFPLTPKYLELNERAWNKKKNWLSPEELEKTISAQTISYTNHRTCFNIKLDVGRFNKMTDFKKWRGELVHKQGQKYPLKWVTASHENSVKTVKVQNFQGTKLNFHKKGKLCTTRNVPQLEKGFTINLEPNWIPFPFDDKFEITWNFDEYKKVDGQLIKVQRKKKKRHPWQ